MSLSASADPLTRWMPAVARIAKVAIATFLVINLAFLVWFIWAGYRSYFHSDAAAKSLLAQEMLLTGHVFPPDWNYVNGDLMVLFGQWFVLPFLLVMRNGWTAYASGTLISAALILFSTWCAARLVVPGRWPRMGVLAIVASGLSFVAADNLFGQVSYGNVYILACSAVVLAWCGTIKHDRARLFALIGLGLLSIGLFWSNPQRAAASYGLPLVAAFGLHLAMASDWRQAMRDLRWPVATFFAGLIVGTSLHFYTLSEVQNHAGAGNARWLDFAGMQTNTLQGLYGLLTLLGCMPTPGSQVVGLLGAWEATRLLSGVAMLALIPVAMAWSMRAVRPARVRFFGAFTVVSFAIVFVLQVTTTIPDTTIPEASARYFVPPLLFAVILLTGMVTDTTVTAVWRGLGACVLFVLMTSAFTNPLSDPIRAKRVNPHLALIDTLKSGELVEGYATYWNAGAVTVLSNDELHVRQILIENGLPTPMRHLGSNRWYRADGRRGPSFFLLTPDEAKAINWESMQGFLGAPLRSFESGGYQIVVYARNPAEVLPNWADLTNPTSLVMSAVSPHQIGRHDAHSRALIAEKGEAGALHFGPYLPIPAGQFVATFDIECEKSAPGTCGKVDIVGSRGQDVLGTRSIPAGARVRLRVDFESKRLVNDLELRVFSDGTARVMLRGITIAPVNGR